MADQLGVHWTTVYRWRTQLANGIATEPAATLVRRPRTEFSRLSADQECIVEEVISTRIRLRASTRIVDLVAEIQRRCAKAKISPPARRSISRRWQRALELREANRAAPGTYVVERPHDSLGNVPPTQFMPRVFKPEVSISGLST
ncbi:MAG: hypothetical protein H6934_03925 [Burkholderiaceae bacterium]|nr:hypothetical protein [Burkholderiaceae bacterium]